MAQLVKIKISCTLAALVLLFQCFTQAATAQSLVGENPMDIVFYEMEGSQTRTLTDFLGKRTVLHFWATWCVPCAKEMPHLAAFAKKHKDLNVVAISYDQEERGSLPHDRIQSFLKRTNITDLPIYWEKEGILTRTFRINSLPATIILDESGREIKRRESRFQWDNEEMVKRFLSPPKN